MKIYRQKFLFFICFFFGFIFNIAAIETVPDKITLKTGEIYVGEILVQTAEIVLIKTINGSRYQFPLSSVKSVEKEYNKIEGTNSADSLQKTTDLPLVQFCVMIDFSGGAGIGKHYFSWSPGSEFSMSIGVKKMFNETLFAGLGLGYNFVSITSASEIISFVPVFVRFQSNNLKKYRTSPYFSLDAGYAFSTNSGSGGGTFAKFSTGIIHKISYKMSVFGGIYARTQGFSGMLTETVNNLKVTYKGNSSISDFGAKVGIQF